MPSLSQTVLDNKKILKTKSQSFLCTVVMSEQCRSYLDISEIFHLQSLYFLFLPFCWIICLTCTFVIIACFWPPGKLRFLLDPFSSGNSQLLLPSFPPSLPPSLPPLFSSLCHHHSRYSFFPVSAFQYKFVHFPQVYRYNYSLI